MWRKNSQNGGYFSNLRECAIEDREAIEASRASRSDAIEDLGAMLPKHREEIEASRSYVIETSRSDAPGASQMMTRRGVEGEAPPRRVIIERLPMPPAVLSCSPHASASFIALPDRIFEEAASMRDPKSVHSPVEEKGPLALASEHLLTCNLSPRKTMRWRFSSFREILR